MLSLWRAAETSEKKSNSQYAYLVRLPMEQNLTDDSSPASKQHEALVLLGAIPAGSLLSMRHALPDIVSFA